MRPPSATSQRRSRVPLALAPAVVYLTGRLIGLAVFDWLAGRRDRSVYEALAAWDGEHFVAIATDGYAWTADPGEQASPAFFPGLPALMAATSRLTGLSVATAGLLISLLAGVVAAYGLVRLARSVPQLERRGGLLLVALFSLAPMSIVLSMVYTEALFCAAAIWALAFALEGRWLSAGILAGLAGAVRPTGIALAIAVTVAAGVALARRRTGWRAALAPPLAFAGVVGYLGYVGYRLADPFGWFDLQRAGWHTELDFGAGTLRFADRTLSTAPTLLDVVTLALMVGAVVLLVVSARRQPLPLVLYSAIVVAQVLGTDGIMNSKARLLLPAFALLIPIAQALVQQRSTAVAVFLTLAGLASAWYGAYAVLIYPYAI